MTPLWSFFLFRTEGATTCPPPVILSTPPSIGLLLWSLPIRSPHLAPVLAADGPALLPHQPPRMDWRAPAPSKDPFSAPS